MLELNQVQTINQAPLIKILHSHIKPSTNNKRSTNNKLSTNKKPNTYNESSTPKTPSKGNNSRTQTARNKLR